MMGAVNDIREANRASPLFTHLTTVSEGIAVLGWITVEPKPAEFVGEVLSSAQFYGNRIITLNKEKSVRHRQNFRLFAHRSVETGNKSSGSMHSIMSSRPYPNMSNSIIQEASLGTTRKALPQKRRSKRSKLLKIFDRHLQLHLLVHHHLLLPLCPLSTVHLRPHPYLPTALVLTLLLMIWVPFLTKYLEAPTSLPPFAKLTLQT